MRKLLLLTITLLALACSKDKDPIGTTTIFEIVPSITINGSEFRIAEDVAYGSHEREVLDVVLPAGQSIGTAVLLHGGAYVRFDKDTLYTDPQYSQMVKALLDNNVTIVNANYKYLENVGLPNPISSGGSLLDWVEANHPGNIVIGGVSAGAGISLYNGLVSNRGILGIVALEMQDLDVHQWEEVFPELNIENVLSGPLTGPVFRPLYDQLYETTFADAWGLTQHLDANDPPIYVRNTVDRPFSLFDIDNLYHNVNHATVFAEKAREAGIEVVTEGDPVSFMLNVLRR